MKKELDIYNYPRKLAAEIEEVKQSKLSERNKELILEFKDSLFRENLSIARVVRYVNILKLAGLMINTDFDAITKKDAERFVSIIQQRDYSPWTRETYKIIFKRRVKWVKQADEYPEEVKWINPNVKKTEKKLPCEGDLYNEEEVKKIIEAADHPRDKALLSLLYESGCRIEEVASLQIKNVEFDDIGCFINVTGKTGARKMRIIASTPFLANGQWNDCTLTSQNCDSKGTAFSDFFSQ